MSKFEPKFNLFLGLFFLLFTSCEGFLDFSKLTITTFPSQHDEIIKKESSVWIEFSLSPIQATTENFFQIRLNNNAVLGTFTWEENRLSFSPVDPLIQGTRYILYFDGEIKTDKGLSFIRKIEIPFYAENKTAPVPTITSITPSSLASGSVDSIITISFSTTIDTDSFEEAFQLSPNTKYEIEWNVNEDSVEIKPDPQWNNFTHYTVQVDTKLRTKEGPHLPYSFKSSFLTVADTEIPKIQEIYVSGILNNTYLKISSDLNTIDKNDSIMIVFSKSIKESSFKSSFSISPNLLNQIIQTKENSFLMTPLDGFKAKTEYNLKISTGLTDTVGNALAEEYSISFTPNIPHLTITSITFQDSVGGNSVSPDLNITTPYTPVQFTNTYNSENECKKILTIVFSEAITDVFQKQLLSKISFSPYFPASGPLAPELTRFRWDSEGKIVTIDYLFSSLNPSNTIPFFFLLKIQGSTAGIINEAGSFLESDIEILWEEQ